MELKNPVEVLIPRHHSFSVDHHLIYVVEVTPLTVNYEFIKPPTGLKALPDFDLGGTGNLPVAVGNLPTAVSVPLSGKLPDNTGQWPVPPCPAP